MNPEDEPGLLVRDFLETLEFRSWHDEMADDFLDWISADRDRANLWHALKQFHSLDNDELLAYGVALNRNQKQETTR